jgi:hypothetical protein
MKKRVEYDSHAIRRMRSRGLTRVHVRFLLAKGLWQPEPAKPGRDPRFSRTGYIGGRQARIVYLENAER